MRFNGVSKTNDTQANSFAEKASNCVVQYYTCHLEKHNFKNYSKMNILSVVGESSVNVCSKPLVLTIICNERM